MLLILAGELVFSLPSGGFGNGFSGYLAKRMGLPIKYLIPAVSENDTLHRFFSQGGTTFHHQLPISCSNLYI